MTERRAGSSPLLGLMNVNVDAAISMHLNFAAVADVACDRMGVFLGASAMTQRITELETMEVNACRKGLALTSDLLLGSIRLASDCANTVKSITEAW